MNWAWTLPLKPTAKLLLMSLSDTADDNGMCFPSAKYIATRCNISVRHTRRELKKLAEENILIAEKRRRKDGSQTSNLYRLNLAISPSDILSPSQTTKGRSRHKVVTAVPVHDDKQVTPVTTIEPSINQNTTTTTTGSDFIWPDALSDADKTSIQKLVVGIPLEDSQRLIRELEGNLSNIKRPVGYFYKLLERYRDGSFVPSSCIQVQSKRKEQAKTNLAIQAANKEHIARLRTYGITISGDED